MANMVNKNGKEIELIDGMDVVLQFHNDDQKWHIL